MTDNLIQFNQKLMLKDYEKSQRKAREPVSGREHLERSAFTNFADQTRLMTTHTNLGTQVHVLKNNFTIDQSVKS